MSKRNYGLPRVGVNSRPLKPAVSTHRQRRAAHVLAMAGRETHHQRAAARWQVRLAARRNPTIAMLLGSKPVAKP